MTDLTEYGIIKEPQIEKRKPLKLGYRKVGNIAYDIEHGAKCYVSEREGEDHRYHGEDPWYDFPFEGDGHGLSVELFKRIHGVGAGRVYIVETDTGNVYQYGFQQFVDGVPINFEDDSERGYDKDPQKVVPLSHAVEVYEDAYPGVYVKAAAFR